MVVSYFTERKQAAERFDKLCRMLSETVEADRLRRGIYAPQEAGGHVTFLTYVATGGMKAAEWDMGRDRVERLENMAMGYLPKALGKAADAGHAAEIAQFLSNEGIKGLLRNTGKELLLTAVRNAAENGWAGSLAAVLECERARGEPHEKAIELLPKALQKAADDGLAHEVLRVADSDAVPQRVRLRALTLLSAAYEKTIERKQPVDWFAGNRIRALLRLMRNPLGMDVLSVPQFKIAGRNPGLQEPKPLAIHSR